MLTSTKNKAAFSALISVLLVTTAPLLATPSWQELRAYYQYDATVPLDPQELGITQLDVSQRVKFTFAATDGTRVPAVLYLPVGRSPAGPEAPSLLIVPQPLWAPSDATNESVDRLVLFLHGLGGSKDHANLLATILCPNGIAVLAIDARLHGDRRQPGTELISPDMDRAGQNMIATIVDNRRALDYIATRTDLNPQRIVLVGVSMGGIFGSILTAVEPRIDGAALLAAGGRWDILLRRSEHPSARDLRRARIMPSLLRERMAPLEPTNFVGHIAPRPLFFANGTVDQIIVPRSAQALHDAAEQPKEVHWYEAGHVQTVIQAMPDLLDWLYRQFTPVEQATVEVAY